MRGFDRANSLAQSLRDLIGGNGGSSREQGYTPVQQFEMADHVKSAEESNSLGNTVEITTVPSDEDRRYSTNRDYGTTHGDAIAADNEAVSQGLQALEGTKVHWYSYLTTRDSGSCSSSARCSRWRSRRLTRSHHCSCRTTRRSRPSSPSSTTCC